MTVLIVFAGVSTLVWVLRARVYHSPPVLPQAWQAVCLLPGLLAACERRLGASWETPVRLLPDVSETPEALPERMLGDVLARPAPEVVEEEWKW